MDKEEVIQIYNRILLRQKRKEKKRKNEKEKRKEGRKKGKKNYKDNKPVRSLPEKSTIWFTFLGLCSQNVYRQKD